MKRTEAITSDNIFKDLLIAMRMADNGNTAGAYRVVNRSFTLCLNERTNLPGIRFGGTFAKADYLLKRCKADTQMVQAVNATRIRLRNIYTLKGDEMQQNFAYDLKAVAQFVALTYSVSVPAELEQRFPANRKIKHAERKADCLRVVVTEIGDYIHATADDAEGTTVTVWYKGAAPEAVKRTQDWAYLSTMVAEGTQLNLVRPWEHEGILYPELIIVEPDYLVDISAVAACFETYSHSPLLHLLGKLRPSETTQAILLGNFAGQLLDETLRLQPDDRPYADSVMDFFRTSALAVATADINKSFHDDAKRQKQNIRQMVMQTLPKVLQHEGLTVDATQMMVEPTFFSEMLGLQGRMDMMQYDQRVVIEQKSGKGGFPQTDPDTPKAQEKHYVQLLLYMLLLRYNNHEQYERNGRKLYSFLYYSKYANGLISQAFAPELIHEALKLRNGIAAAEFSYTRDGLDVLTTLTPDKLNELNTRGILWERYQRPQLAALLQPISQATPLERAYYLRMLRFIETEHLMAKIGNQTKENSGFADKWHSTLEEKLQAGSIYASLRLLTPSKDETGTVETVVLAFEQTQDNDISNFRTGDIVILYPYNDGEEPDARRTMVFRATIQTIGDNEITLRLRHPQTGSTAFWHQGERAWAIEHDFFESSYTPLYRGIHSFLSAPRQRRDLLLCQREPETDQGLQLRGDYGSFNQLSLRVRQARDIFLIIGPPGTGKTSYGMLNTLKEELLTRGSRVLLMSYTNRAVDEICGKLQEENIDFLRIGSRLACEQRFIPNLLEERARQCKNAAELRSMISQTRVIAGTTSSLNASPALFSLGGFSLAIIDEASQILEPHLLGLLSATDNNGQCAIRKIVMIGDHKQLPAVVQQKEEDSRVTDSLLRAIHLTDCRLSLFERLLSHYGNNPECVYMLTRQGRMHHDIADFPSQAFYSGRLEEVPLPHQVEPLPAMSAASGIERLLSTQRTAFINVEAPADTPSDKVNRAEAQAIVSALVAIYNKEKEHFSPLTTAGVIVPYRNQVAEIRKAIEHTGIEPLRHISVDTVERYQGSQRDYILYGFTVQRYYQLDFLTANVFEENGHWIDRKLNVAMTRARRHLLLFGNASLLSGDPVFSLLLDYMKQHEAYLTDSQLTDS